MGFIILTLNFYFIIYIYNMNEFNNSNSNSHVYIYDIHNIIYKIYISFQFVLVFGLFSLMWLKFKNTTSKKIILWQHFMFPFMCSPLYSLVLTFYSLTCECPFIPKVCGTQVLCLTFAYKFKPHGGLLTNIMEDS